MTTTTGITTATLFDCAENENYVAMWRNDHNNNNDSGSSFDEYASLEVFAFHQQYDDQFMYHRKSTATTKTTTRSIAAAAAASSSLATSLTADDKVMAETTTSFPEEERQDHEGNVLPACPADEHHRKSSNLFVFASGSSTPTLRAPPPPPTSTGEPFFEMEPEPASYIVSASDNNSIMMDDDDDDDDDDDPDEEDLCEDHNNQKKHDVDTVFGPRPRPLLPVSRCSSLSARRLTTFSLVSPTPRSSSTRSVAVRTISLANEDVVVLEEPTDIRRVSFASQEATYVESDLPYLTEDDIARYFWGDRECLESRMQRRQLVNTFKRHMRHHPEPQWTEEIDSVRGLEDHFEEIMGRANSHLLRRRHEREILTEYYRMKSEGKMCSERLGAVSRQSSYEECQRAARAAAEDAIVAANDQNTYSIFYRAETTTGTTASALHKRSRSMSPTTSTKSAEKRVSFMDSLQGMVSCGVGYE